MVIADPVTNILDATRSPVKIEGRGGLVVEGSTVFGGSSKEIHQVNGRMIFDSVDPDEEALQINRGKIYGNRTSVSELVIRGKNKDFVFTVEGDQLMINGKPLKGI